MAENAAETQGAVADSAPTGESSKIMSDWACGSESKEGNRGKDQGGSWEAEDCGRGEEKDNVRVSPTTLRWDARGRSSPFGGH